MQSALISAVRASALTLDKLALPFLKPGYWRVCPVTAAIRFLMPPKSDYSFGRDELASGVDGWILATELLGERRTSFEVSKKKKNQDLWG